MVAAFAIRLKADGGGFVASSRLQVSSDFISLLSHGVSPFSSCISLSFYGDIISPTWHRLRQALLCLLQLLCRALVHVDGKAVVNSV